MPLLSFRILLFAVLLLNAMTATAATITGTVTNEKGEPLPFSSITIKNSTKGAIANSRGAYSLTVSAGEYMVVCHHVGYKAVQQQVNVLTDDITLNFQLLPQELTMTEVVIKRGEDPALEIMRQTIKKRDYYNRQVDSFTVDVYIKGLIRSRAIPDKFFGQKIDKSEMMKGGIDSAGKGILFLSESETKVAYKHPDKLKLEVVSSRQSGGGFGISVPFFVNFYKENVALFSGNIAPRGFISPLADGAFRYYIFRYEGNFFEGNKMIDRIKVTPRRKNEPLFTGFIQVVDGEWRIHSLSLSVDKQYGLDLLDTVKVTQVHAAINAETWRTENQVVSFAANMFGFDITGDFLNVYRNYNLNPGFRKNYFNRVIMKYDTAFNKRDSTYWSNRRPVPLETEEKRDFIIKDSVYKWERDSMYSQRTMDSLRRSQKPMKLLQFFRGGVNRNFYDSTSWKSYHFAPLLNGLQYNTVEGVSLSTQHTFDIQPRRGKNEYEIGLNTRYGFSNGHLNAFGSFTIKSNAESFRNRTVTVSGGKRVFQFNRNNPIEEFSNTLSTLFYKRNYIKLYEAWFGKADYSKAFESGVRVQATASYENRIPVQNSTDFSLFYKDRQLLPNHPFELASFTFERHAATVASVTVSYQPGQTYIELPERKIAIGSKYPTFEVQYTKGLPKLFNSVADFDKWQVAAYDNTNLKLLGLFKYRVAVGGFLNRKRVDLPDFQHFNGNQLLFTYNYLNTFQLAPYYRYSNIEKLYGLLHAEHHFNGLLTNKIPLFNRLKWHLVAGTNTFYVNSNNYYVEVFAGLENIFKILRADLITAVQPDRSRQVGIRLGFGGVIGNSIRRNR